MWKGIMERRRWTNDVGIYAELVVIFQKSRKCLGGHQAIVYFERNTKFGDRNWDDSSVERAVLFLDKENQR